MELDDASKVAALTSTVVAIIISVAAYFGDQKVKSLEAKIKNIDAATKLFDEAKRQYVNTPRVAVDYSAALARSFALRMPDPLDGPVRTMIPTNNLSDELLASWRDRKGLMTGQACKQEGLKARQIALIQLTNYGPVSADDVRLLVKKGNPVGADQNGRWNVVVDGVPVRYGDLSSAVADWPQEEISVGALMEADSAGTPKKKVQIVLASVSGSSDFYGPILVPLKITWINPIKQDKISLDLGLQYFRSGLLGAEIGSLSAACQR